MRGGAARPRGREWCPWQRSGHRYPVGRDVARCSDHVVRATRRAACRAEGRGPRAGPPGAAAGRGMADRRKWCLVGSIPHPATPRPRSLRVDPQNSGLQRQVRNNRTSRAHARFTDPRPWRPARSSRVVSADFTSARVNGPQSGCAVAESDRWTTSWASVAAATWRVASHALRYRLSLWPGGFVVPRTLATCPLPLNGRFFLYVHDTPCLHAPGDDVNDWVGSLTVRSEFPYDQVW